MTGNPMLDKLLSIFNLAAVFCAVGVFVYTNVLYQKPLPQDSLVYQEFLTEMNKGLIQESFEMNRITTNLISKSRRLRFIDFVGHIEPTKSRYLEVFEQNEAIIRDIFIEISSKMDPLELNTLSGKIILESRLKKRVNQYLGNPAVKKIYFTKFIIQ